jgi:hypothetical protein
MADAGYNAAEDPVAYMHALASVLKEPEIAAFVAELTATGGPQDIRHEMARRVDAELTARGDKVSVEKILRELRKKGDPGEQALREYNLNERAGRSSTPRGDDDEDTDDLSRDAARKRIADLVAQRVERGGSFHTHLDAIKKEYPRLARAAGRGLAEEA